MVKKHIKKYSTSLVIGGMKIIARLRFHLTLVEWLSSRTTTTNIGEDVGKKEPSYTVWWECKLVEPVWKTVRRVLKTKNGTAISFLGM
jgi:hypothetical protein